MILCILEFLPLKVTSIHLTNRYETFQGLLYLSLLMSLNRLAVFTFPCLKLVFDKFRHFSRTIKIHFHRDSIGWAIFGCWITIVTLCIISVFVRPMQKFNRVTLKFEDSGDILIEIPALKTVEKHSTLNFSNHSILQGIDVLDSLIPFIIIVVYVLIFLSVQKKRRMIK